MWDRISVERWIFTAAHELGHLLLHPEAYNVSRTDEAKVEEDEADAFAGYFLMPDRLFEKEWAEARGLGFVDRMFKIKRIFHVSWQTVLYRVAFGKTKQERTALWRHFNAAYKRQHGQSLTRRSEPEALDPRIFTGRPTDRVAEEPARLLDADFREDRLSRLVRSAVETEKITMSRAAEVLQWALPKRFAGANVGTLNKGQLMPTPYLTFDGTTKDAFAFYAKVLGGEIEFSQTFGESPMKDEIPAEYRDRVMHATLRLPDGRLMASDAGPWAPFEGPMRSCGLSLHFKDVDKARRVFDALAEGGNVTMPFDKTFWAAGFGMLTDRFGVAWMVNCDSSDA